MTTNSSYVFTSHDLFLHQLLPNWLVHDEAPRPHSKAELELIAQVRSGDYFEMLATKLDNISKDLADKDATQYDLLEDVIKNLLYLQQKYKIVKK